MKTTGAIATTALLAVLGLACEREQGPMERAGEKFDQVMEDITHPDEGPLERAGRKADEAIEGAKKKLEP